MFGTMTPWGTRKGWPLTAFALPTLMDRMMKLEEEWPMMEAFAPEADVIETAGRYDVKIELPGMKPEDGQRVGPAADRPRRFGRAQPFQRRSSPHSQMTLEASKYSKIPLIAT